MQQTVKLLLHLVIIIFLTIITQIGGVIYLFSLGILFFFKKKDLLARVGLFCVLYLLGTYVIIPPIAKWQGRERIENSALISPTNYITILCNRNYVVPELNHLLIEIAEQLSGSDVKIKYLDANFPFINGFPLLPHLSHNDGRKIDLSLVYENQEKKITDLQKSISGYGVYEEVRKGEWDQPTKCLEAGNFQYDFPKYLTLGSINNSCYALFPQSHIKAYLSIYAR